MSTIVKANNSLAPSESGGPSPLSDLPESANVESPIEESVEEEAPEEEAPEEESAEEEAPEEAKEEEAAPEEAASARNNTSNNQNEVEASAPGVEIPAVVEAANKTRKVPKGSTGLTNPEIAAKVAELKTAMAAKGINPGNAILRQAFFHYMRLKQSGTGEDEAIRERDALIQTKMAEAQQPKKGKCPPLPADLDWGSVKGSLRRDFDGFLDSLEKKVSAWLTRKSKRSGEVVATRVPKSAKAPKASKKSNSRNSVYEALTRKRSNNNGKQYYKRPPKELMSAVRKYRSAHPSQSTKAAVKEYMLAKEIANKKARSNKSKAARAAKKVTIKSPSPAAANNLGSVARSNE
jgi:hypothetical protein